MKQILSLIATTATLICFLFAFYMALHTQGQEQLGWDMILFISMALLFILFGIDEKSTAWRWIETIGAVGCIGFGVFFGLHYIQVL
jgi:hypothetical protein